MPVEPIEDLARELYNVYCMWKMAESNRSLPRWHELDDNIKARWRAFAEAGDKYMKTQKVPLA